MNLFSKTVLAASLVAVATTASATNEVSGRTDITVTLPEILVLYHYDLIEIEFTGPAYVVDTPDDSIYEVQAGAVTDVQPSIVTFTSNNAPVNVATAPAGTAALTGTIDVTLEDVWGVRSISSDKVVLDVELKTPTLTHTGADGGTSIITLSNATLISGESLTTDAIAIDIAPSWTPVLGDIKFTMDLSAANHAGKYVSTAAATNAPVAASADDTFLLTLTGNVTP